MYEKTILNPLALKTGDLMYIDNFEDQCLAPVSYGIEPPTYCILTPTHGIFTPCIWHIEPPIHGLSNPTSMVNLLIRNERVQYTIEVQFTIQGGGAVFNKGGQFTMGKH